MRLSYNYLLKEVWFENDMTNVREFIKILHYVEKHGFELEFVAMNNNGGRKYSEYSIKGVRLIDAFNLFSNMETDITTLKMQTY